MASSVSFGIYFAIAGAVFLDDYKVPQYTFKDWQLLAGIPPGLFAALVGALQTAPIFIAVVTAFLTMEGVKYILASRKQARSAAAKPAAPA